MDVSIPVEPDDPVPDTPELMDPVFTADPDDPGHLAPRHSSLCSVKAPTDATSTNIFIQ